ncbi:MAG: TIGR04013 family B12-binding domain/radical SAM domain-containing protein [Elusimicrobiales bacterium]|jgi:B12-binding domain/radical SAM domain protein|nr:TIGR04013 family B12-binding domain/radical SAM domain-containing protein [Elusimicrobiales bacterium]
MKPVTLIFLSARENIYSLAALSGALESLPAEGFSVRFADDVPSMLFETAAALAAGETAVAALSFSTMSAPAAASAAAALGETFGKRVVLIAGGPHPSGDPGGALEAGFDYVFRGEAEVTLPEFIRSLGRGDIPDGRVITPSSPADLDAFPPGSLRWGRFAPVEITRGCPYACAYCQTSFLFGAGQRHRSVDKVRDWLEKMSSMEMRDHRFISPDAFSYGSADGKKLDLTALEDLLKTARGAAGPGGRIFFGSFPSEVRPDHVTPETLMLLKAYADNRALVIGAQTGSDRLLEKLGRGHDAGAVLRAARLCYASGVRPVVDFIFGLPGETPADEEATIALIETLLPLGAKVHAHSFMPLPGTPLAGSEPPAITPRTRKFISSLSSTGRAFGPWENQERAART